MTKAAVRTDRAPQPPANFAQGCRKGNLLQVAGQVAFDPDTGKVVGDTVTEQTRQTFKNIEAVLAAAGSSFDDVIMVRVYLTDTAHFAEFNEVYNTLVTQPYAARTTVYVGLPPGILLEVDALAVLD